MTTIFEQEKIDGLEELILSKGKLQFDCEIKPNLIFSKAKQNESKDLFCLESILSSVGWNNNDDIFDRIELWNARNTPVNKKFNFMHDEKDIIGHITKAYVLDKDGNIIPDDTKEEDLPDFFEIGVASVMYSYWEDQALRDRFNKITEEIPEGKWFVSMEVLFPSFDYALSRGSEQKILERNQQSSFLTKHLRAYGGSGTYDGWKIGRKLKNMFFSGKGLVDNPANKRSLITSYNFYGAKASLNIFNEAKMTVEKQDYEKAVAELGATKQVLEAVKSENETLKSQVESSNKDLEAAKAISNEKTAKISELESAVAAKDVKIKEVTQKLAEMLESAKATERVSKLVSVGVELAKAQEIVSKFSSASDEMFSEVVDLYKSSKPVETAAEKVQSAQASESAPAQSIEQDADDVILAVASFIKEDLFQKNKGGK